MEVIHKLKTNIKSLKEDKEFANDRVKIRNKSKGFVLGTFRWLIIIGISYVILSPLLGMLARAFFSTSDAYNPMVYLIPQNPTLDNFKLSWMRLDYVKVVGKTLFYTITLMIIQVIICSMVGYGFARFDFPFKKLLFACVIITIVVPTHTVMLPFYMTFRNMDLGGLVTLLSPSHKPGLLGFTTPMYILTLFGCGLRSGLYIYIFNQFFRGLPKEIEEAALIDGAGTWYTYFRIMLVNAVPSIITVAVFSLVWQYNDKFYANLFVYDGAMNIGKKLSGLQQTIANMDKIADPTISILYFYAGVILVILPVVIIYVALQKYFMEGVERSGIVG